MPGSASNSYDSSLTELNLLSGMAGYLKLSTALLTLFLLVSYVFSEGKLIQQKEELFSTLKKVSPLDVFHDDTNLAEQRFGVFARDLSLAQSRLPLIVEGELGGVSSSFIKRYSQPLMALVYFQSHLEARSASYLDISEKERTALMGRFDYAFDTSDKVDNLVLSYLALKMHDDLIASLSGLELSHDERLSFALAHFLYGQTEMGALMRSYLQNHVGDDMYCQRDVFEQRMLDGYALVEHEKPTHRPFYGIDLSMLVVDDVDYLDDTSIDRGLLAKQLTNVRVVLQLMTENDIYKILPVGEHISTSTDLYRVLYRIGHIEGGIQGGFEYQQLLRGGVGELQELLGLDDSPVLLAKGLIPFDYQYGFSVQRLPMAKLSIHSDLDTFPVVWEYVKTTEIVNYEDGDSYGHSHHDEEKNLGNEDLFGFEIEPSSSVPSDVISFDLGKHEKDGLTLHQQSFGSFSFPLSSLDMTEGRRKSEAPLLYLDQLYVDPSFSDEVADRYVARNNYVRDNRGYFTKASETIVQQDAVFISPLVISAQSVLEGAGGSSGLVRDANNPYGIKAKDGYNGKTYKKKTREERKDENGKIIEYYIVDDFIHYETKEEGYVKGYASRLGNARYTDRLHALYEKSKASGTEYYKNPFIQILEIKKGGYATDFSYVKKISGLIKEINRDYVSLFDQRKMDFYYHEFLEYFETFDHAEYLRFVNEKSRWSDYVFSFDKKDDLLSVDRSNVKVDGIAFEDFCDGELSASVFASVDIAYQKRLIERVENEISYSGKRIAFEARENGQRVSVSFSDLYRLNSLYSPGGKKVEKEDKHGKKRKVMHRGHYLRNKQGRYRLKPARKATKRKLSDVDLCVIHFTHGAGVPKKGKKSFDKQHVSNGKKAHFSIDENGRIIAVTSLDVLVAGAGESRWDGTKQTRKNYDLDKRAIHIEIVSRAGEMTDAQVAGLQKLTEYLGYKYKIRSFPSHAQIAMHETEGMISHRTRKIDGWVRHPVLLSLMLNHKDEELLSGKTEAPDYRLHHAFDTYAEGVSDSIRERVMLYYRQHELFREAIVLQMKKTEKKIKKEEGNIVDLGKKNGKRVFGFVTSKSISQKEVKKYIRKKHPVSLNRQAKISLASIAGAFPKDGMKKGGVVLYRID